jgi:CRISPR-associated endoribonuclease Cas6
MLISIIVTLTPEAPAVVPAELGRAIYAEVLGCLRLVQPELAAQIHASDGPKPLTCSGLIPGRPPNSDASSHVADSIPVRPGERYSVRVTGLVEAVSAALRIALLEHPPERWNIQGAWFRVLHTTCDAARHPWAGTATYEGIASWWLKNDQRKPRSLTLQYASPTAFKSQEMQVPVPMPNLAFGSLVERWNAFSSITLDPDIRRFALEQVGISRYSLESRPMPQKNGALRIGGIGQATYVALENEEYALGALNVLADFALYSGVGVQTTTGMGQCRRVP